MLFALILLPFGGQGQRVLNDKDRVSIHDGSVLINQPGTYTITGNSTKTNNTIKIECESNEFVTLNIDKLYYDYNILTQAPIDIVKGNVKLQLIDENKIIFNEPHRSDCAAIHVSANSSLIISNKTNGSLIIQAGNGGAGIGGNTDSRGNTDNSKLVGDITIESGTIEVVNLYNMGAIGGGNIGQGISNITINGGYIIAKAASFQYGPVIGACRSLPNFNTFTDGGTITMNGGTLITSYTYNSIGSIGHSTNNPPAKVIIGDKASVLFDPGLSDVTPVNSNGERVYPRTICGLKPKSKVALLDDYEWSTDVYADDNGKIYFWWPSGHKELDFIHTYDEGVPESSPDRNFKYYRQSLTVNRNGTSWDDHDITFKVINNAKEEISCSDNKFYLVNEDYSLYADGVDTKKKITIKGASPENITLDYYTVTYDLNEGDNNPSIPEPKNYLKGTTVPVDNTVIPTREHYTFGGWALKSNPTTKVESIVDIQAATTLYAIWKPNEFTVNEVGKQELTYKTDMSLDLSSLLGPNAETDCGAIAFNIDNGSSLPAGLKLEGSTITGAPKAVTKQDITTSITATAANTFSRKFNIEFSVAKANATIANIDIPAEGYTYSGKAIEIAPPKVSGAASDNLDATLTYYTSYTNENNNTKTTSENSGAAQEGGAPVYAGNYVVVASFAGNDNYNKADNQSAKFDIKRKELTVTPVSNQIIYKGDEILYEVKDAVNGETPEFDGALKVDEGIIIQDNGFKLKDSFSKNYSFIFTSGISATVHNGKASEAVATMKAEAGQNDWFTSNVTITPPADFKIELVPSNPVATLKSNEAHKETLLWDTEGVHTISYTLHRQSRSESYPHALSLKLDKTPPTLRATVDNENYTLTFSDGDAGSGIAKLLVDDKEVSISDTDASYAGTAPAGAHKAKVFDKAGLSYEIEFTLTKKSDNPGPNPGPDPGPKPTPTRYDVTLTDTTGVIFTPAAGKYKVDAWGKFDFSIEVAKGYTMFSDPIVYVNNVKLPSKDSKGNYSINPVREDKVVKVTGIVSDLSTANEAINAPDRRITVKGKTIYVDVPDRALFHLFDITGSHKLSRPLHPGTNRIDIDPGSYIGRIDNEKEGKVIIVK